MNRDDRDRFLALLGQPQARLTAEQAACVLNCQSHDIPILVSKGLLQPLGNPAPNGTKYFSTSKVLEQAKDDAWLSKMTKVLSQHWQTKNARKKDGQSIETTALSRAE